MATKNNKKIFRDACSSLPWGEGGGRGPQSIKNREAFFDYLEQGLQAYFDKHDREFGGIIHLTVGVKVGKVGGIIKGDNMLRYDGFTTERVREILKYILPTYMKRSAVPYAIEEVIDELTGKCRHTERPEEPEELRMGKEEEKASPRKLASETLL